MSYRYWDELRLPALLEGDRTDERFDSPVGGRCTHGNVVVWCLQDWFARPLEARVVMWLQGITLRSHHTLRFLARLGDHTARC